MHPSSSTLRRLRALPVLAAATAVLVGSITASASGGQTAPTQKRATPPVNVTVFSPRDGDIAGRESRGFGLRQERPFGDAGRGRRRQCSTPARASATSGSGSPVDHGASTSCSATCTSGLMFFAPLFMPDAEIVIWARPMLKCFLSASPATLPAAQAASSARAPGQALLARLPKRRVGDRRCAYDAPVAHAGPHPRLPDRRGRR